jgi:predicted DNA-binding transcriptional regulator YafY
MGIKQYKDYRKFSNIIKKVNQAATECRRIEMLYLPLRSKKQTHRKIDPYKIWILEGTIYIIGFCHLRNEVRTFVVDRIKLLRLLDEKFELSGDFDINEYTKHCFKVMQDELYTVKVRVTPAWARYIGEKIWHESQKSRKLKDGSLELTFQVAGLDEIKQWIMGLGPEAYVEEPKKLRDMIKADMKKALVQYEGIRSVYQEPALLKNRVHSADA